MKSMLLISIVIALFLFVPDTAYSCACCNERNTLHESETSLFDNAKDVNLKGEMVMYIYGGRGFPDIEIGKGLGAVIDFF